MTHGQFIFVQFKPERLCASIFPVVLFCSVMGKCCLCDIVVILFTSFARGSLKLVDASLEQEKMQPVCCHGFGPERSGQWVIFVVVGHVVLPSKMVILRVWLFARAFWW